MPHLPLPSLVVTAVLLVALPAVAAEGQVTRMGARIIRQVIGTAGGQPTVVVLDEPEAWKLATGETLTAVNGREFFFNLEATTKRPPPRVEVRWPGVAIARVIGAAGEVERVADGVRFTLAGNPPRTNVITRLPDGPQVQWNVFHNLEARRAGPYRDGPWPAAAIQAQLNYLGAAREAARAMGLTAAADPGFKGQVVLNGFETNFPQGHVDHPPHFHIMLAWPGWTGTQATHLRLDANGRITNNEFMAVDQPQRNRTYPPGERCDCVDPDGRVGFSLTVEADGLGVVWQWPGTTAEYRLRGEQPTDVVEVERRATAAEPWSAVCRVRVEDDAAVGKLRVIVTPPGREAVEEVVLYDPDTGALLPRQP